MKKNTTRKRRVSGTTDRPSDRPLSPSSEGVRRRRSKVERSTHVTQIGGNVFADLGFPPEEAANLKLRSLLMRDACERISGMTQIEAGRLLGVSQPRVSDLVRGKIGRFTIDALVNMLANAGMSVRLSTRSSNISRRVGVDSHRVRDGGKTA